MNWTDWIGLIALPLLIPIATAMWRMAYRAGAIQSDLRAIQEDLAFVRSNIERLERSVETVWVHMARRGGDNSL
jgi:hypothetical protein